MTANSPDEMEWLARYFSGECTAAEATDIETWIASDQERERWVNLLHRGWEAAGGHASRGSVDRGWYALQGQLDEGDRVPRASRPSAALHLEVIGKATVLQRALHAAAIVLAVGLGGAATWNLSRRAAPAPVTMPAPVVSEVTTKPGQRARVDLSDGTHVVLGVASRIRFAATLAGSRDVELDGEAYFDVAHDSTRPFTVRTPFGIARDLGTKFTVRAYPETHRITVAVREGSVALDPMPRDGRPEGAGLILGASDVGRIGPDDQVLAIRHVPTEPYFAWTTGRLVFDQTPVREAVAELNRWYGVTVRLGDTTVARVSLSASLTHETFPQAIEIVAAALDARVERRGSAYTLHSNREPH